MAAQPCDAGWPLRVLCCTCCACKMLDLGAKSQILLFLRNGCGFITSLYFSRQYPCARILAVLSSSCPRGPRRNDQTTYAQERHPGDGGWSPYGRKGLYDA